MCRADCALKKVFPRIASSGGVTWWRGQLGACVSCRAHAQWLLRRTFRAWQAASSAGAHLKNFTLRRSLPHFLTLPRLVNNIYDMSFNSLVIPTRSSRDIRSTCMLYPTTSSISNMLQNSTSPRLHASRPVMDAHPLRPQLVHQPQGGRILRLG